MALQSTRESPNIKIQILLILDYSAALQKYCCRIFLSNLDQSLSWEINDKLRHPHTSWFKVYCFLLQAVARFSPLLSWDGKGSNPTLCLWLVGLWPEWTRPFLGASLELDNEPPLVILLESEASDPEPSHSAPEWSRGFQMGEPTKNYSNSNK